MVVTTTNVRVDNQTIIFLSAFQSKVVDLEIDFFQFLHIVARTCHSCPEIFIANHTPSTIVKLNIATTCLIEFPDDRAIGHCNVLQQLLVVRIELVCIVRIILSTIQFSIELRWSRNSSMQM